MEMSGNDAGDEDRSLGDVAGDGDHVVVHGRGVSRGGNRGEAIAGRLGRAVGMDNETRCADVTGWTMSGTRDA